ncbi:MAG: type II CAAX endopeptidase family protein [Bacillota bacterium]|nr:type II CAAX endopeptidase family protein [Bacillota bacterium]
MNERIRKNPIISCLIIYTILIIAHGFETIVLRMDETILGENVINKLFGIIGLYVVLRLLGWKWSDIGFAESGFIKSILIGFALAVASFAISYGIEISILKEQGHTVDLGVFTSGFSLTGETAVHSGIGHILICILFNIINVIMEEGTFRGLFYQVSGLDHSETYAMLFQALLFGIWHIVTPIHNLIDGDINTGSCVVLSIGYIILAGMMGIKWQLLYRLTGNLYAGMADHFFNNCIATNLLHVITETGTDEMMIIRVMTAQLFSFVTVSLVWKKKGHGSRESANQ